MNSGNLDFVYGATDWEGELTTTAVFAEVAVPLGDNIDINGAIRYEEFDELGVDTTDPKVTVFGEQQTRSLDELLQVPHTEWVQSTNCSVK